MRQRRDRTRSGTVNFTGGGATSGDGLSPSATARLRARESGIGTPGLGRVKRGAVAGEWLLDSL